MFLGVNEGIYRTQSGADPIANLNDTKPWLICSLIHKFGRKEDDATLLDRTQVLYGSNLGNGNNHDTRNLPIILAGGGYKHGQHLAFDKKNNEPLPNLFVSMLQRLGIETAKFASSKGTMRGLELV